MAGRPHYGERTDVIAVCECHPDVETCFARFAEHGVGERWQKSMEGLIAGLTDETGERESTFHR